MVRNRPRVGLLMMGRSWARIRLLEGCRRWLWWAEPSVIGASPLRVHEYRLGLGQFANLELRLMLDLELRVPLKLAPALPLVADRLPYVFG